MVLIIILLILIIVIIFSNWSDYLLSREGMYPFYRKVLKGRAERLYNQYKILCDKNGIKGKRVIDFGCGFGGLGYAIRNIGNEVESIDVKKHYIYEDKNNFKIIKRLEKEGDKLEYGDKSYDIAVSSYCFHHIPKKQHNIILSELERISDIVILLEEDPSMNFLCRFLNSEILTHANSHMTKEDWKIHLNKLGYSVKIHEFNSKEFGLLLKKDIKIE